MCRAHWCVPDCLTAPSTPRLNPTLCAPPVAMAVGCDVFRPDARTLIDALINIQSRSPFPDSFADLTPFPWTDSPVDPSDTLLATYLIATWAKLCQALGPEFEPFLPVVMPPLLNAASAKADVSIYGKHRLARTCLYAHAPITLVSCVVDEEDHFEREGWETISMDGQIIGIRTSTIDEKCQAFDTLVIYCSILGGRFGPYLTQSLELTLPALQFYFHEGVREAACRCAQPLSSWEERRADTKFTQTHPTPDVLR